MKHKHIIISILAIIILASSSIMGCIEHHHTSEDNITLRVDTPSIIEKEKLYWINITLDTHNTSIAGIQFSFTYNIYQSTFMALLPGDLFPTEKRYIHYGKLDLTSGTITGISIAALNTTIKGQGTVMHLVFTANTTFIPTITLFDTIIGDSRGKTLKHNIVYD